jgi:hypothetical protein
MDQNLLNFSRTHGIGHHFFDVSERKVFYEYPIEGSMQRYHGKKVIINEQLREAISIIPDNFSAVTNLDAFNLGKEIFDILFQVTPSVYKEYSNYSGTEYGVDLVSKDVKIMFRNDGYQIFDGRTDIFSNTNRLNMNNGAYLKQDFQDEYHPFVRVHNSLRSYRSFYIEMGYYRYACSNGILLGRKTKITFRHSYIDSSFEKIRRAAINHFNRNKFIMIDFAQKLWNLFSTHISQSEMRKISFDIFEKTLIKKDGLKRERLQGQLNDLVSKYSFELGENLNAALNVATDFAKLLEDKESLPGNLQNLPNIWLNKVSNKRFHLKAYLDQISEIEMQVMTAKSKKEVFEEEY